MLFQCTNLHLSQKLDTSCERAEKELLYVERNSHFQSGLLVRECRYITPSKLPSKLTPHLFKIISYQDWTPLLADIIFVHDNPLYSKKNFIMPLTSDALQLNKKGQRSLQDFAIISNQTVCITHIYFTQNY